MKNLKINGSTEFMGMELPIIEGGFGEDKRAMLVKDIAKVHNKEVRVINQNINRNRIRFRDNEDLIDLRSNDTAISLVDEYNVCTRAEIGNSKSFYLLSDSGYAVLLNIMEQLDEVVAKKVYSIYFKTDYYSFISVMKRSENIFFDLITPTIKALGLTLLRQYSRNGSFLDGYIPELKLAIEYDEGGHEYYDKRREAERQKMFEDKLGCKFIRVSDELGLGKAISEVVTEIFFLL